MTSFLMEQVAALSGGRLVGPGDVEVSGLELLEQAGPDDLTYMGNEKYAKMWPECKAAAALVEEGLEVDNSDGRPLVYLTNVEATLVQLLEAVSPPVPTVTGQHPSAIIDESASIGENVGIGPNVYIGPNVKVGDNTQLHANVSIYNDSVLGSDNVVWDSVSIRERSIIGDRCIIHANVVIGADGFGFRPSPSGEGLMKIPQIGYVQIGNDVEIGANTCIDRGKFSETVIGDGTKLDNLVQIGHNVRIGKHCILCAMVGVAGSTIIEDQCMLGGKAAVKDHVTIGQGSMVAASSAIMSDVPAGSKYGGYPAKDMRQAAREYASMSKLPELVKLAKRLERDKK